MTFFSAPSSRLFARSAIHPTAPSRAHSTPSIRICRRHLHKRDSQVPNFAFAFDIDGVLCRSSKPLQGAQRALKLLRANNVPFILLTNGGGKSELARVQQLSQILDIPIEIQNFVQSHTPFESFSHLRKSTVLVMGGPKDGHSCRLVAEGYGFGSVVTPLDLYAAHPGIWPFGPDLASKPKEHIKPLPRPLAPPFATGSDLEASKYLKIDAALVFNDPRAWSLDCSILLDTLLSEKGYIGTLSPKNKNDDLPNRGFLQDGQPSLIFSNPDVFWAAEWPHSRLGQGAFRAAFEGVWRAATDGASLGKVEQWGKPHAPTYKFAEQRLAALAGKSVPNKAFKTIYMVGDNPESDIRGANDFKGDPGTEWRSVLVRSGVYSGGEPRYKPTLIVDGVLDAVRNAFLEQGFQEQGP